MKLNRRSQQLLSLAMEVLDSEYNEETGFCRHDDGQHRIRQTAYFAEGLLARDLPGDRERAAEIVHAILDLMPKDWENIFAGNLPNSLEEKGQANDEHGFSFTLLALLRIHFQHQRRLDSRARKRFQKSLYYLMTDKITSLRAQDGNNGNFMNTACLCLGGEVMDVPGIAQLGYRRLRDWLNYDTLCGFTREYSPTYLFVDLEALTMIENFSRCEPIRALARVGIERLWLLIGTHYHAPTAQLGGAYYRAYHHDHRFYPNGLRGMFYKLLGDERFITEPRTLHDIRGNICCATMRLYFPAWLKDIFLKKRYPWRSNQRIYSRMDFDSRDGIRVPSAGFRADWERGLFVAPVAELIPMERAYPHNDISCYQTADYIFGSASQMNERMIRSFDTNVQVHYRRPGKDPDFGVLTVSGPNAFCRPFEDKDEENITRGEVNVPGRIQSFQHENRLIAAYTMNPVRAEQFGLCIALCTADGDEQVWIGRERVSSMPTEIPPRSTIFIQHGAMYFAFRLVEVTDVEGGGSLSVRKTHWRRHGTYPLAGEELVEIVLNNYEGARRDFDADRAEPILNGYVMEIGHEKEYKSMFAFQDHILDETRVEETMDGSIRTIQYEWPNGGMELSAHASKNRPFIRKLDGQPVEPDHFESPCSRASMSGDVEVGDVRLQTRENLPALLAVTPNGKRIAVVNSMSALIPVVLSWPDGRRIDISEMPTGTLVLDLQRNSLAFDCIMQPKGIEQQGFDDLKVDTGPERPGQFVLDMVWKALG